VQAQPVHDREARAIDERERLVGELLADLHRAQEVAWADGFDLDGAAQQGPDDPIAGRAIEARAHQPPELGQHRGRGDRRHAVGGEHVGEPIVPGRLLDGDREERRCVDEDAHCSL
jgi:hypothetical protein